MNGQRGTGGWKKSTRSGDTGSCVEAAHHTTTIAIRDSKNQTGPAITMPIQQWHSLLRYLGADVSQ